MKAGDGSREKLRGNVDIFPNQDSIQGSGVAHAVLLGFNTLVLKTMPKWRREGR